MKKYISIFLFPLFLISFLSLSGCSNKEEVRPDPEEIDKTMMNYIDSLIENTTDYTPSWNRESFKGKWNYIDGVFLNSIVSLYYSLKDIDVTKANAYKAFFLRYINYYLDEQGNFINLKEDGKEAFKEGELDTICESRILFDAYEMTKDTRYLTAIDKTYTSLMNQPRVYGSNNFSHKKEYLNQIWLDGLYMYVPFYARYAILYQNEEIWSIIKEQYKYIRNHMFDENMQLYYHGYDSTKSIFWADQNTGCSKTFWLRSMGWYLVSLCDVLDFYPDGENKEYLKQLLQEAIDGILLYQDNKTKMFYQVIDKKNIKVKVSKFYLENLKNKKYAKNDVYHDAKISNYLESSGSSMIAYTLLKAAKAGYIDSSYYDRGIEVFEGIYMHSFKNNSLNDICITAGLGPENRLYRDGTISYYLAEPVGKDDAKGVGPFIMAYLAYAFEYKDIPNPINIIVNKE